MPSFKVFDQTMNLLKKVMDLRLQNQQTIASNIANADTPGFTPVRLDFEKSLQAARHNSGPREVRRNPAHFPLDNGGVEDVQARIIAEPDNSQIGDGNGVVVEQEMIALAENQILYEAAAQMFNKKIGLLKYVVQEGR